jgi:hypothetical protein
LTWTYTLPITTDLDRVRYLIGDTVEVDPLLQNEEITYALSVYVDVMLAAASALRALIGRYLRETDVSIGGVSVSGSSNRISSWQTLADQYDPSGVTIGSRLVLPKFGGLSIAQKEALSADTDVPRAFFSRTFEDNSGVNDDADEE